MASTQEHPTLFDPSTVEHGNWAPGLPDNVKQYAAKAARTRLFSMPRHNTIIGDPDEEKGVEFWRSSNEWHEYCGAIGLTLTAKDIALNGARTYMSDKLGAPDYPRFIEELEVIATEEAAYYNQIYPVATQVVTSEAGL